MRFRDCAAGDMQGDLRQYIGLYRGERLPKVVLERERDLNLDARMRWYLVQLPHGVQGRIGVRGGGL